MNTDKLLDSWAKHIDQLKEANQAQAQADISLDSVMATEIAKAKAVHGSTTAKDIAKGNAVNAKLSFLNATNEVKIIQAKIKWLESAYTWERVQYSGLKNATK